MAVAAEIPVDPPEEWFYRPEADEPTRLTYEDSGEVYGHLALWGSCHIGFLNGALSECISPKPSMTNYAQFHLAPIRTAEGRDVDIGKVTFDTGHAPLSVGMQAAARHYDNTGSVGAYVRAKDGKGGIWLSGSTRSNITREGWRDLRANPPSGDWRGHNGHLELIVSLAVVVPGFPIVRPQLALAAAANGEQEVVAMILPGFTGEEPVTAWADSDRLDDVRWARVRSLAAELDPPRDAKAYLRRRAVLAAALKQ